MWSASTYWFVVAILSVAAIIPKLNGQSLTSQQTIDEAAASLDIKLSVQTNHVIDNSYKIVFQLNNKGTRPILVDDQWRILFSMREGDRLTKPEFLAHGLRIKAANGCFFEISKKPGAQPSFPGLQPRQAFQITIEKKGLSVFKYDIDNDFVITGPNLQPKVIASTADKDLGFVYLAAVNNSFNDVSVMTPFRRAAGSDDIQDMGGLGRDMIIPRTKNITFTPGGLIDLSENQRIFIWLDNGVSETFKTYLTGELLKIRGVTPQKFVFVASEPSSPGFTFLVQIKANPKQTKDGYTLVVEGPTERHAYNMTHLSASDEKGLYNGFETFKSMVGIFSVVPEVSITDDADTNIRSVKLDVTKTFIPVTTIMKFIALMKLYKLNQLVLVLGSDDAMRIPLQDTADFTEIELFATNYCSGRDTAVCNPPYYKGVTDVATADSGYYTVPNFVQILTYAKSLHIDIVPYVNLIGSLRSAKKASHLRYERLKDADMNSAQALHLMSEEPIIADHDIPAGSCYTDGILDPCNEATKTFAVEVINTFRSIYEMTGIPFDLFHAGGDGFTKFFGSFPSCQARGYSQADAMRLLVGFLQNYMNTAGGKIIVHEDAVIDPTTGTCLQTEPDTQFVPSILIVEFTKLSPGRIEDWNLTPAQLQFLTGTPIPFNESVPGSVPDILRTFNGPKQGLAPWSRAYDCANNGFNIILSPNNYFALDMSYELDFHELGHHNKDGFFVVNLARLMTYEPQNMHLHMDVASTGATYIPYRFPQIFNVVPLTKTENLIGLQASIDTRIIRSEHDLWYMTLPRLLLIAQKMWHRSPSENLLRVEEPSSLLNVENVEKQMGIRRMEMVDFLHNLGYKEFGRLDAMGYTYRIPRVEAHIRLGLAEGIPPPYPLMAKTDVIGMDIELREINGSNIGPWRPLFQIDPSSGILSGGYFFDFPDVQGKRQIEIRTKSADENRNGQSYLFSGKSQNYDPKRIPPALRGGACLPIAELWIDFDKVSEAQWKRVIGNIYTFGREETDFRMKRQRNLTTELARFNRNHRQNYNVQGVLGRIMMAAQNGTEINIANLPTNDPTRLIYSLDRALHEEREKFNEERFIRWEGIYQRCLRGQSHVLPPESPPAAPSGQFGPAGGPGGAFPGPAQQPPIGPAVGAGQGAGRGTGARSGGRFVG